MCNRRLAPAAMVLVVALASAGAAGASPASSRTAFVVALDDAPSWRDLAFLACLPPASALNGGRPALLAVGPDGQLPPYLADYLGRYRPRKIYFLPAASKAALRKPQGLASKVAAIKAGDLSQAAAALALLVRPRSDTVVVCDSSDYGLALSAAAVAARIGCPLLYCRAGQLDERTRRTFKTLKPGKVILAAGDGECDLPADGAEVERIRNDKDAIRCLIRRGLTVNYLAATNPLDRASGRVKKLSLIAPVLAAGRRGAVAVLPVQTVFKKTFVTKTPAEKTKAGVFEARAGRIVLGDSNHPFVAYKPHPRSRSYSHVLIDGKGPYSNGREVILGGDAYSLTVEGGGGTAVVRITRPTAGQITTAVRAYYGLAPRPPEYVCIVAMPDAIPPGIYAGANNTPDVASDDALGNADDDPFYEVAVARFAAHSVFAASGTAARSLTYPDMLALPAAKQWKTKYLMAQWNILDFRWDAQRAGLTDVHWHNSGNQKQLARHLGRSSLIFHEAHSTWLGLGGFVSCNLTEPLAPCLAVSAGCLTAALDKDPRGRSVALQMLQQGAVAYVGSSRPAIWPIGQMISCFWGNVLKEDMTVGQAFLAAQNVRHLIMLENRSPLERYQFRATCLYGDPAWKPHIPRPRPAPAAEGRPAEYTLRVPQTGQREAFMPPKHDWGYKRDEPLYNWRADGIFIAPFKRRHKRERFRDWVYFVAGQVRTTGRVKDLKQHDPPKLPETCELKWSGRYHLDANPDGSTTLRWLLPAIDWDAVDGRIVHRLPPARYTIEYRD